MNEEESEYCYDDLDCMSCQEYRNCTLEKQ